MAMNAGTVAVADDGTVSGSGPPDVLRAIRIVGHAARLAERLADITSEGWRVEMLAAGLRELPADLTGVRYLVEAANVLDRYTPDAAPADGETFTPGELREAVHSLAPTYFGRHL